jgi:hypothetical protein
MSRRETMIWYSIAAAVMVAGIPLAVAHRQPLLALASVFGIVVISLAVWVDEKIRRREERGDY